MNDLLNSWWLDAKQRAINDPIDLGLQFFIFLLAWWIIVPIVVSGMLIAYVIRKLSGKKG